MYSRFNSTIKWIFSVFFSALLLVSCTTTKPYQISDPEERRALLAARVEQSLVAQGVNVAHIGQTVRLTILSDQLFNPRSANLAASAPKTLNTISYLLLILQSTSVQVAGYTNTEYSEQINRALSARQAQVIVDYLWSHGVDSRLMYAVGKGSQESLRSSSRAAVGLNRRIEIQFQYVPLLSSLP